MNLTLEAIQIIDMIDRKGSFAGAAEALNKVPSALTYSIRKLEEDLDVLLFDRRGHRAKLTTAGKQLLTEGRMLLDNAEMLEQRVKHTAVGRETELRIVLNNVIPMHHITPIIQAFDQENSGTRLRFSSGVLSDEWEQLIEGHADLIIGATYDGPDMIRTSGRFNVISLGQVEWVFVVSPDHPLAQANGAISPETIKKHRIIVVADMTSARFPSITRGILDGQDRLIVPNLYAKIEAQLAGIGCGHIPRFWAQPYIDSGRLIELTLSSNKPMDHFLMAWDKNKVGKSLQWFIHKLSQPETQYQLLTTFFQHT